MDSSYRQLMILRSVGSEEFLRISPEFTAQSGYEPEHLAAVPFREWLHPDDRSSFDSVLERGLGCFSARHRTANGGWLQIAWQLKNSWGGLVVLGTEPAANASDEVSSTSRAQAKRRTMKETLESMARIVEEKNPGMRCSILLIDRDKNFIIGGAGPSLPEEYNRAVEGLLIGPAVGSCGTAAFWNTPVVVENIFEDPLWKDLRDAAEIAGVFACWSHPVTSVDGQVLGAMALYNTEPAGPTRHQMEGLEIAARMVGLAVERDRLEEQLHRAMKSEAIGVLAAGVAHDFNNMLTTVLGNAELALTTLSRDSETAPMLREIVTASLHASELCEQLLAYAGRGAQASESVECNALVKELGNLMQVTLSKKATLRYDLSDELLSVVADRSQLRQILLNLITNAAEAVGDVEGQIVVGTDVQTVSAKNRATHPQLADLPEGDYARIWVSDTGAGMDKRTQTRIFDPFFTTKTEGRGLGLAAVQGLVQRHGGVILFDSEPGKGTTFSVYLPREEHAHPEPVEPSRDWSTSTGGHILLVDDEHAVRKVIGDMLETASYHVTRAGDGQEALDLFRRDPSSFDCILLDLSMPKLNGEETFREIRKLSPSIPVILSSGFTEQDVMDRFRGAGLFGFIQKPPQRQELLSMISAALAGSAV